MPILPVQAAPAAKTTTLQERYPDGFGTRHQVHPTLLPERKISGKLQQLLSLMPISRIALMPLVVPVAGVRY